MQSLGFGQGSEADVHADFWGSFCGAPSCPAPRPASPRDPSILEPQSPFLPFNKVVATSPLGSLESGPSKESRGEREFHLSYLSSLRLLLCAVLCSSHRELFSLRVVAKGEG